MTEAEWLACEDPARMLAFLEGTHPDDQATPQRGRGLSERKRRLFACACCRGVPDLLADTRNMKAVLAAERYADGTGGPDEIQTGTWFSQRVYEGVARADCARVLRLVRLLGRSLLGPEGADTLPVPAADAGNPPAMVIPAAAALLREIVGNPFRRVEPFILRWPYLDRTKEMAQRIYDERDFGLLPILADALEDAGCEDAEILNHLRSEKPGVAVWPGSKPGSADPVKLRGPHVRGCWAVDMLLGKE